jgi:hypothetical protein
MSPSSLVLEPRYRLLPSEKVSSEYFCANSSVDVAATSRIRSVGTDQV